MPEFKTAAINKAIFNLITIGRYKKGDVLDTTTDYINIVHGSLIESIRRTVGGDSRTKAVARFRSELEIVYEYSLILLESKYLTIYDIFGQPGVQVGSKDVENYDQRRKLLTKILESMSSMLDGVINFSEDKGDDYPTRGETQNLIEVIQKYWNDLKLRVDRLDELKMNFDTAQGEKLQMFPHDTTENSSINKFQTQSMSNFINNEKNFR